jgi:lipopolysaccharide transport system permease protein
MFSEGLQRAMGSVAANAGLIRKVAFPHRLVVYAAVLAHFGVHLVGFVAVLVVLRLAGEPIRFSGLPAALVLLVPYMMLATGIGAALAALQTLVRDVEHGLGVAITVLFYATPILYPSSLVPPVIKPYVEANPLAYLSERLREVLLQGGGLVAGDALAALGCAAVLLAGLWFFNRLSPHFEDFL